MTFFVAIFLALAVGARAQDPIFDSRPDTKPELRVKSCLKSSEPEAILAQGGSVVSGPAKYDFASCLAVAKRDDNVCQGLGTAGFLSDACRESYSYYLMLALMVRGAPPSVMAPLASRLNMPPGKNPEQAVEMIQRVYRAGRFPPDIDNTEEARSGSLSFLLGKQACAAITDKPTRAGCLQDAALLDAVKAGNPALCHPGDFACRGIVSGPTACAGPGAKVREQFCRAGSGGALRNPGKPQKPSSAPATGEGAQKEGS